MFLNSSNSFAMVFFTFLGKIFYHFDENLHIQVRFTGRKTHRTYDIGRVKKPRLRLRELT